MNCISSGVATQEGVDLLVPIGGGALTLAEPAKAASLQITQGALPLGMATVTAATVENIGGRGKMAPSTPSVNHSVTARLEIYRLNQQQRLAFEFIISAGEVILPAGSGLYPLPMTIEYQPADIPVARPCVSIQVIVQGLGSHKYPDKLVSALVEHVEQETLVRSIGAHSWI
jgi:hypothetical protein